MHFKKVTIFNLVRMYNALRFRICKALSVLGVVAVLSGISKGKVFTDMTDAELLSEQGPHSIFLSVPLFSCLTHAGSSKGHVTHHYS
jgi:hypothetical protein